MKKFRKAILIIHGFAGGVYDQEFLAHRLELIENYDVFTFTLPGHDGDCDKKITAESWINKAEEEINFLINNGYTKIYVIGHSMGGVIASYLTSKYHEVKKLVLVAPAFRYLGFESGSFNFDSALHSTADLFEQYGLNKITSRMLKLPMNCFSEFSKLVNTYKDTISNVNVPTLIFRGTADKIVPQESVEQAYENLKAKKKKIIKLSKITHDVFKENMKEQTTQIIIDFFKDSKLIDSFPEIIEKKDEDKISK